MLGCDATTRMLFFMQNTLIKKWLCTRQSLLVMLQDVCTQRDDQNQIKEFHGQILDYLSLSHFKLLNDLFSERRQFAHFMEALLTSTEAILHVHEENVSLLTEKLAHRFELEDKLIINYLSTLH